MLLHVFARPSYDVLARFERLAAARAIRVDARALHRMEGLAFEAAEGFEGVVLPPVLPLGATGFLGGTHQNNVLSCLRGLEVMADPTTWLGLEAARRRKASPDVVRLCCSQRVIRMQPLPGRDLLPHFQLFALATAGVPHRGGAPELGYAGESSVHWLRQHATVWLTLLGQVDVGPLTLEVSDVHLVRRALASAGVPPEEVRACVRAHDLGASRALLARHGAVLPRGRGLDRLLEKEVLEPLSAAFPGVEMAVDLGRLEGLNYYCGPVLRISAGTGSRLPFVDGGLVDWPGRLLQRKREAMFASGVGLDLLTRMGFGGLRL